MYQISCNKNSDTNSTQEIWSPIVLPILQCYMLNVIEDRIKRIFIESCAVLRTYTPVIAYKEILHSWRYISAMTFDFNKHTHWKNYFKEKCTVKLLK